MPITLTIGPGSKPRLVNPDTGEELDAIDALESTPDEQAALYGQVVAFAGALSALRSQLKDSIEVLHKEGAVESAQHYGGVKLTRTSSRKWDDKRLGAILDRLVEEDVITETRAKAVAPAVEVIKPDGRKLNALLNELAGTDAAADLASTKTDSVNWSAKIVEFEDVPPVAEQTPPPTPAADPVDAFFGSEAA